MKILSSATLACSKVREITLHLYRGQSLSLYSNTCLGNKPLTSVDFLKLEFCFTQSEGMWVPLRKFLYMCSSDCAATVVPAESVRMYTSGWDYDLWAACSWVWECSGESKCICLCDTEAAGTCGVMCGVHRAKVQPSVYWYWCMSVIAQTSEWSTDVNVYVSIGRP